MTSSWDASTYDRISDPQAAWAVAVVDRLHPQRSELVLDAGCGSGRVTEQLLERGSRVLAVDADADMVRQARERLGDRVERLWQQDLLDLEVPEPVDAVFSNAVFHWIEDHPRLFARLHAALKPGGRVVTQCGGHGNLARLIAVAREAGADLDHRWSFPDPETAAAQLHDAGFAEVETWLEPMPTTTDDPVTFLATVTLREQPDPEGLAREVVARLGDPPVMDYVRLNICARRPEQ